MANFDPFGKLAEAQRWQAQDRQQREQNALARALQEAQLGRFQQEQEQQQTLGSLLQQFGQGGMEPNQGNLFREMAGRGLPQALQYLPHLLDPYASLPGDVRAELVADKDPAVRGAIDRTRTGKAKAEFSPDPLAKMLQGRQALIDRGLPEDHPHVRAYDSRIAGVDVDVENMNDDQIDMWGNVLNLTGKMPTLGRGKVADKARARIASSAARQALGPNAPGEPGKAPMDAALETIGSQSDTKSIAGAQAFIEKQLASMGSFVANIDMQVEKVRELSHDLETFDTRLLNVPLRAVRRRLAGSPLQAKYDMYLTEIEGEIGKLASGSAASIAELSVGAQEKWARIHDKNLSIRDMMELLDETKAAARMREKSVADQLEKTRQKMRTREPYQMASEPVKQQSQPARPPGAVRGGVNPATGKMEYFDASGRKI
jgi:hypothetical protein